MTVDFQTWMRAVWTSIMEPSDSARKAIDMKVPRNALWTALALVAVLNVLLVALGQAVSPVPVVFQDQVIEISPFVFAASMGVFYLLFVFGILYAGQIIGGVGTLDGALTIVVWFQSISLTIEAIQLVLALISPAFGAIFSLLALGALLWCFLNFVNVLHAFENLGKAFAAIMLALLGIGITGAILVSSLGIVPTGGAS